MRTLMLTRKRTFGLAQTVTAKMAHLTTRSYFGRDLCVTPLHVSYGQIGYTIHFPYSRDPMPELAYDWEMDDLTIDEKDWQKWLSPEEDDEEEE